MTEQRTYRDRDREGLEAAENGMTWLFFCCETLLLAIVALIISWRYDTGKQTIWGVFGALLIAEIIIKVRRYVFGVIDARWQTFVHMCKLFGLYLVFLILHKVTTLLFGLFT